jgi:hypothetical protein
MNRESDISREIHVSHFLSKRITPGRDGRIWTRVSDPAARIEIQYGITGGVQ